MESHPEGAKHLDPPVAKLGGLDDLADARGLEGKVLVRDLPDLVVADLPALVALVLDGGPEGRRIEQLDLPLPFRGFFIAQDPDVSPDPRPEENLRW